MKKIAKLLSLLLCLALCLSAAAFASGEASGEASDGAYVASSEGSSAGIEYGYTGSGAGLTVSGAVNAQGEETVLENQAIIAVGSSAIQDSGTTSIVARDSVIVGVDPAPTAPLTGNPGNLLVAGNVRTTLALSQSHAYYINSTILSSNWAALSTDGAVPATEEGQEELSLYAYGSLARTIEGGYGAYSDLFCNLYLYGSDIEAAEIGIISGTYGSVVIGTIADGEADENMAARLTDGDKDTRSDKDQGSIVSGGRNAIMIHSVNLPPYWEYEGYSQEELPLHSTFIAVKGSTLRTDLDLDMGIEYDAQKQAYIDHTAGSVILIKSTNAELALVDTQLIADPAGTGAVLHSVYNNDTMFMNAVPDGEQYPGIQVYLTASDVTGDVIHEDYQRDMNLLLTDSTLTGAVNGYDCDHWNAAAAAEGFTDYALDASYATAHGVSITLENGSAWTVTGESHLNGLTVDESSAVIGAMTVDGVPTDIVPGEYFGDIVLTP